MTWVWILLAVVGIALCGVCGALVTMLRRMDSRTEAAPVPLVAPEPDPAVIQSRVDTALAEQRVALDAERQRLETAARDHDVANRTVRDQQEQASRLSADASRRLAEAERAKQTAEEWATQERSELRALRQAIEAREQRIEEREERLISEGRSLETRTAQLVDLRTEAKQQRDAAIAERAALAEKANES